MGDSYYPAAYGGGQLDFSGITQAAKGIAGGLSDMWDRQAVQGAIESATGPSGEVDYNKAFGNLLAAGRTKEAQVIANYAESQEMAKYRNESLKPDSVREFEYLQGQSGGAPAAPAAPAMPEPMRLGPDGQPMTYEQYLQKKKGPTVAQESVDRAFGKDYADWNAGGGYTATEKTKGQLEEQIQRLGKSDNISGPWIGLLGDVGQSGGFLGGAAGLVQRNLYPESIDTRQQIEEAIQTNLRRVLGSQYTEKEGENLLKRTFDPGLDEGINMRRAEQVLQQLDSMAKAKDEAARYYEANGTLTGWQGSLARSQSDINIQDNKIDDRLPPDPDLPPEPAPGRVPASTGPTETNVGGTIVREGPGAAPPQPSTEDKNRLIAAFKRYGKDPETMQKVIGSFNRLYQYPGLAEEILYEVQAGR
jgi:hypothetical protein